MSRIAAILIGAPLLAAAAAMAATAAPAGVTRTDLLRSYLSVEGREAVQARIDFARSAVVPWHCHAVEGQICVIVGRLEYQLEGQAPITLKAGDVLFVPAGTAHTARNTGSVNGAELGTYIVRRGKPLLVPAKEIRSTAFETNRRQS